MSSHNLCVNYALVVARSTLFSFGYHTNIVADSALLMQEAVRVVTHYLRAFGIFEEKHLVAILEVELNRRLLAHLRFSIEELNDPAQLSEINAFSSRGMSLLSSLGVLASYPVRIHQVDHVMMMRYRE